MTDEELNAYVKGFELGYKVAIDESKENVTQILNREKLYESFWQYNNAIERAKIGVINGLDKQLKERREHG